MFEHWNVKGEVPMTPSLNSDVQTSADFPLLPLASSMHVNPVKTEEAPEQEEQITHFPSSTVDVKFPAKTLDDSSPSLSPTLNGEFSPQKLKLSPSSTPPPSSMTGSKSSSPTPQSVGTHIATSKKAQSPAVQLINDLPIARETALATFTEITENNYQYKSLGRSREPLESMTCDCTYDPDYDSPETACGHDSDCINRLTQVECLPDDCRCGSHCHNQRFQKRQYSDIEIVQTEKKGFGLRAERGLLKDTFIYEYVGDVVNPVSFRKRMREYAQEGIQHFYFMMLQKDEFIDATKNGGIGRFANHSCRPNCYVAKWTVDQHVRMGIFAKRDIQQHEELTFNYNVDRYGHQAQICHCGEPNCVGYIGGKTQTDMATIDDLSLYALGITDEVDMMEIKGTKKKRGKKIDDPDFMPALKPIVEKDVPKVVQAIRQTQSRKVLAKLLTRIKISDDQAVLRQIMRLRGYSLMTNLLDDHPSDAELIQLTLECMSIWPLLNRNKVEDSRVIIPVKAFAEREEESRIKELAQSESLHLVAHWDTLPLYNRIPKRVIQDGEKAEEAEYLYDSEHASKRIRQDHTYLAEMDLKKAQYVHTHHQYQPRPYRPREPMTPTIVVPTLQPEKYEPRNGEFSRESIRAVIEAAEAQAAKEAAAAADLAAAEAAEAAEAEAKLEAKKAAAAARAKKKAKKPSVEIDKETMREKQLTKLVGAVVVKCMSKHSKTIEHDSFKKHAKELTEIIVKKEKNSSNYKEGKLYKLSEEKITKIKKFAKEYIAKLLRKLEKSKEKRSRASPSTPVPTASSSFIQIESPRDSYVDGEDGVAVAYLSDEDMDAGSESDGERDVNDHEYTQDGAHNSVDYEEAFPQKDEVAFETGNPQLTSDPRRRPPVESIDTPTFPSTLQMDMSGW